MLTDREGAGEEEFQVPRIVASKAQTRYQRKREYLQENLSMPLLATSKS
jgi:hypothetical protein